MSNPILLGKAEVSFNLEMTRQELVKYLLKIEDALPDTYTSITLICRTDKEKQEIVLSNKYDVDADINALKTCIKEPNNAE